MKTASYLYKRGMAEPFRRRSHLQISWNPGPTPEVWEDADIVSATVTNDVDPLARKLPTESITFGIIDAAGEYDPSNPDGKWEDMDEGLEIAVRFGLELPDGTVEWLAYDAYYLDGRPAYNRNIATFRASSLLSQIAKTTYYKGGAGTNVPIKDMAASVAQDAGLSSTQYDFTAMPSKQTSAVFPVASHAQILQMIAHATGCAIYTRGGKIYIAPVDIRNLTYQQAAVRRADIVQGNHQVNKSEPLQRVDVYSYKAEAEADTSKLAEQTVFVDGTETVHIEYPAATGITVSISAGIIDRLYTYAHATDITITNSGGVTITITGKKVNESRVTYSYAGDGNADHAVDIENNPLVTFIGSELGNAAVDYFSNRVTDTLSYRGEPAIEALDGIYLETPSGIFPGIVVKHTIKFNGALAGTMTVRRVQNSEAVGWLYDVQNSLVTDEDDTRVLVISQGIYKSAYTTAQMDAFITSVLGE